MHRIQCFCEFNALRKNQLLAFYPQLQPIIAGAVFPGPQVSIPAWVFCVSAVC